MISREPWNVIALCIQEKELFKGVSSDVSGHHEGTNKANYQPAGPHLASNMGTLKSGE